MSDSDLDQSPKNPDTSKNPSKKRFSFHLPHLHLPHFHKKENSSDNNTDHDKSTDSDVNLSSPEMAKRFLSDDSVIHPMMSDFNPQTPNLSAKRKGTISSNESKSMHRSESTDSGFDEFPLAPSTSSSKLNDSSTQSAKKSFFSSIFGNKKSKLSKRKHSMDAAIVAASNPDLCLSLQYEQENFYITVAVVGGIIIPFFVYLCIFAFRLFLSLVVFYGQPCPMRKGLMISALQVSITITFILLVLAFTIHRILGYIAGFIVRYMLATKVSGKSVNDPKGIWNIHIAWISYRCFLDHNEVVIHHALWRNPKDFNRSPYLIKFKELSVSFNLFELIELIRTGKDIKFDQIILDGVEIFFERKDDSLSVLSRPRSSSKVATPLAQPQSNEEPAQTIDSPSPEPIGYNTLNVWAAIGCESVEQEERMFSGMLRGIYHDIETKIKHKLAKPFQKHPHTKKLNDDDEVEEENSESKVERKRADSNPQELQTNPGMPTFVLNRLLIFDLVGHPLDILSGRHMEPRRKCDICIDIFHLTKHDITGKPYYKGEERRILSAKRFGQLFGEQFADVMFQKCGAEIANIIMETTANRTMTNICNIAHDIKEMMPRMGTHEAKNFHDARHASI